MAIERKQSEYTVPEASAMLGLSQQQVNNALERDLKQFGLTKVVQGMRTVSSKGLVALELLGAFARMFQPAFRQRAIRAALKASSESVKVCTKEGCVVVYISEHLARLNERKARLARAKALVVSNPEVLSGEPCIKGTRVPAYLIGALARRHGVTKTHKAYPFIPRDTIESMALYVSASPRRGRPPETALQKAKAPTKRGKTKKAKVAGKSATAPSSVLVAH